MKKSLLVLCAIVPLFAAAQPADWANYGRYAEANAQLATNPDVVFMGNSITDGWDDSHPEFFADNNFACRGISGQVTSQMLCRFRADVINLHPKAVVILAGTNDLALNNGPIEIPHVAENIISMAELALAAGIRPILCSVLPAAKYNWRPEVEDVPGKIRTLNNLVREYAEKRGIEWVDYHPDMATPEGALRPEYTYDGVHPTRQGYDVMERILAPRLELYKSATR